MNISCDCGAFIARLTAFPGSTPGRLVCYCSDCQDYVERLGRGELLDAWGGTEVVPVYPSDIEIEQGREHLRCYQLNENGLFRWAAACCRSPVFNTQPGFPWAGIPAKAYTNVRADALDGLGDVRCRIYGRDAKGEAPFPISSKIAFRDMMVVLPFIIKGKLLGKHRHSPFFESDGKTPTVTPEILGSR